MKLNELEKKVDKKEERWVSIHGIFPGQDIYNLHDEGTTEEEAQEYAYESALEEYDNYAGLHGIRDIEDIMEEEEVDEDDAQDIYDEEKENTINYYVEKYDPKEHDGHLH